MPLPGMIRVLLACSWGLATLLSPGTVHCRSPISPSATPPWMKFTLVMAGGAWLPPPGRSPAPRVARFREWGAGGVGSRLPLRWGEGSGGQSTRLWSSRVEVLEDDDGEEGSGTM
jgi:hypothetical protein